MSKAHFARIDFYEAIQLLGLGLVDFDNTYTQVTQRISEWNEKWESSVCFEYVKTTDDELVFDSSEDSHKSIIRFNIPRIDLLSSIALLINLRKPKTIRDVSYILDNLMRPDEYLIDCY